MDKIDSMLYGDNLEDDAELMAELMMLSGEAESTPSVMARSKPEARTAPRVAPKTSKPTASTKPAQRPVDFDEIDRLTKQISVETTLNDDEDDGGDIDDDDLEVCGSSICNCTCRMN